MLNFSPQLKNVKLKFDKNIDLSTLNLSEIYYLIENYHAICQQRNICYTIIANKKKKDEAYDHALYDEIEFLESVAKKINEYLSAPPEFLAKKISKWHPCVSWIRYLFVPPMFISKQIAVLHPWLNWLRLSLLRASRAVSRIGSLLKRSPEHGQHVGKIRIMEVHLGVALGILSWVFFIPRLINNFLKLFFATVPGFWMTKKQLEIDWFTRLEAEWRNCWTDICTDLPWFLCGVITFFVLTGGVAMATTASYLAAGLFFYDTMMSLYKSWISIIDLKVLRDKIYESDEGYCWEYVEGINQHITYQLLRSGLMIGNSLLLFMVSCVLIVHPIGFVLPIVCTSLIFAITLINFIGGKLLETYAAPKQSNLVELSLFKKVRTEENEFDEQNAPPITPI